MGKWFEYKIIIISTFNSKLNYLSMSFQNSFFNRVKGMRRKIKKSTTYKPIIFLSTLFGSEAKARN